MPTDFPNIQRGTTFSDVPARQWQNAFDTLQRLANMQGGPGVSVNRNAESYVVGLSEQHKPTVLHRRRVILVREPAEGDWWLDVRGVRYLDNPPRMEHIDDTSRLSRYQWDTDVIQAYPAPGIQMSAFVGSAFVDRDDEDNLLPIQDSDVFLDAYWERDAWYVYQPVYPDRFVVCRAYLEDDPDGWGRLLVVQEVEPELGAFEQWNGGLLPIGEQMEVNVWPTMKAADFAPFLWVPEELNDETTILPLTFWRGTWWLKQRPKRAVSLRRGPLRIVDCQPTEAVS